MAERAILRYPHRALKTPARVADDPAEVERVTRDLLDTMGAFGHCVGLAAPQLGEVVRIAASGWSCGGHDCGGPDDSGGVTIAVIRSLLV